MPIDISCGIFLNRMFVLMGVDLVVFFEVGWSEDGALKRLDCWGKTFFGGGGGFNGFLVVGM